MVLPFALLSPLTATWVWIGLSLAAFLVGVAILPVSRSVRWWIVLLAGLSFPFVHAVKLGQVGPILFLAFAIGWRGIDDPVRLGGSAAVGAAIKLQPGLVLVWALLTRRFRAVAVGIVVLVVLAVAATLVTGPGAWVDFVTLLRAVSDPIATERNVTPGAIAYQLGAPTTVAAGVQLLSTVGVARRVPRGDPVGDRRSLVPGRRDREPAGVADPLGPLRHAPAAAGGVHRRPLGAGGRSRSRS